MRVILPFLLLLSISFGVCLGQGTPQCYRTTDDNEATPHGFSWNDNGAVNYMSIEEMFFPNSSACVFLNDTYDSRQFKYNSKPPYLYRSCLIKDPERVQQTFSDDSQVSFNWAVPNCICQVPKIPLGKYITGIMVTVLWDQDAILSSVHTTYGCYVSIATSYSKPQVGQNFTQIYRLREYSFYSFQPHDVVFWIVALLITLAGAVLLAVIIHFGDLTRPKLDFKKMVFGWQVNRKLFWRCIFVYTVLLCVGITLLGLSLAVEEQRSAMMVVPICIEFTVVIGVFWLVFLLLGQRFVQVLLGATACITLVMLVSVAIDIDPVDPIFKTSNDFILPICFCVLGGCVAVICVIAIFVNSTFFSVVNKSKHPQGFAKLEASDADSLITDSVL